MTKMAAMPIYGKNPSKIFFSGTGGPISKKLGVKHLWLKYYNVYINHDPVMTLTQFMARSTWVYHAFKWGKLLIAETLDSVSTVFNEIAQHPPHTLCAVCNWSIGHLR